MKKIINQEKTALEALKEINYKAVGEPKKEEVLSTKDKSIYAEDNYIRFIK